MTTNSIPDSKKILRQTLRSRRQQMSPADVAARSEKLANEIIETVGWSEIKTMHCFLPLVDDNEPDMRSLIEYALNLGIKVYTSDPSKQTGRKVLPVQDKELQEQIIQYDIDNQQIDFDIVIVPMLGFDPKTKHRLGFGGGFYDRLIEKQPDTQTIGVCFDEFVVEDLPIEPTDKSLQKILSC